MKISPINIVLAVLLTIVVLATTILSVDLTKPNYEMKLPANMKYSPAYHAYKENEFLPNGRTLQPPVKNTIARGQMILDFEATSDDAIRAKDAIRAGKELLNPTTEDELSASVKRGAKRFRIYCGCCHGPLGEGDGMVGQRGFRPPPTLLSGNSIRANAKDGKLFHIITYGQGLMPDMEAQLSPAERWDVVNFIRNLQDNAAPPEAATDTKETTDEPKADSEEDKESTPDSDTQPEEEPKPSPEEDKESTPDSDTQPEEEPKAEAEDETESTEE